MNKRRIRGQDRVEWAIQQLKDNSNSSVDELYTKYCEKFSTSESLSSFRLWLYRIKTKYFQHTIRRNKNNTDVNKLASTSQYIMFLPDQVVGFETSDELVYFLTKNGIVNGFVVFEKKTIIVDINIRGL